MIQRPKDNLSAIRGVWETGGESREVEFELSTANHFPLKDTDPQQEGAVDGMVSRIQDIPTQKASKGPLESQYPGGQAGVPEQLSLPA